MKRFIPFVVASIALSALPTALVHATDYKLPGSIPRDAFDPSKSPRDPLPRDTIATLPRPDIVVTRAHVTEFRHNRQWKVDYCVKNIGSVAAPRDFFVRFANTHVGSGLDVTYAGLVGTMQQNVPLPGMAPGVERCSYFYFFIPSFAGATDFFTAARNARVIADYTALIHERYETNNERAVTFTSVY
jgi:hypothetical protein